MLKRYKDFLLEDYGDDSFEDPTFKTRFEKFKAALSGKSAPATEPTASTGSTEATPAISTDNFSGDTKKMVDLVVKSLNKYGITNPLTQKAILSTIGKESGFKINRSETAYRNTSASRIKSVFPVSGMSTDHGVLAGSAYFSKRILPASSGASVALYCPGGTPSPNGKVFMVNEPSSCSRLLGRSF